MLFIRESDQAFLYNGIHQAVLVFGFHENILNDDTIENFRRWLWNKRELLGRILGNHISVGTILHKDNPISLDLKVGSDFIHQTMKLDSLKSTIAKKI